MTPTPSDLCGGCQGRGSCRLGVATFRVDPEARAVVARAVCAHDQMAGPGIAHGGWTAAVFDDVLGRFPKALGEWTVTSDLQVRYLRPVPIEHDLVVLARMEAGDGKRRVVTGELYLVLRV